ncbi:MAG: ribonuclease III [Campylobacter sp.]
MKNLQIELGYEFKDEKLLKTALTHKSFKGGANNERLEFLGDAVMDLIVGDYLFNKFLKLSEGDLSKLRAALVNEKSFANLATYLGLGEKILISTAEEHNGGRAKASILSDAFEALIGAIYLESGFETVKKVSIKIFEKCYPNINFANLVKDYKTTLQELTQAHFATTPKYVLVGSKGPDHNKEFQIALQINEREISRAVGKSKKEAEQKAAKRAIEILQGEK